MIAASYAVVAAVVAILAARSREPVLVQGHHVLRTHAVLLIATTPAAAAGEWIPWVITAAALPASWAGRRWWWVLRPSGAIDRIESAFPRVLAPFERVREGYALAGGSLAIGVSRPLSGVLLLRARGDWAGARPRAIRAFLAKQFRGIIPVIVRIRV